MSVVETETKPDLPDSESSVGQHRSHVGLRLLRSKPVTSVLQRLTKDRLRILGYHGVADAERFDQHMKYVAANYNPVSASQVIERVQRGTPLPDLAVWVTFDDGDPTVVHNGLPSLERHQIPATMFVCPGLIESAEPFWWRVTQWASEYHPQFVSAYCAPDDLTEHVKTLPDKDRRQIVDSLMSLLEGDAPADWRSLSVADLSKWTAAGMTIGNHSWDHPCLDQCSDAAQQAQIHDAHKWLSNKLGDEPRIFAYPNGNYSPLVDVELEALGYQVAVMYDNALTSFDSPSRQLSRLMMESDHPVERLVGVMSGMQPGLKALASRLP